jgi:hypothetical protein
MKPLEHPQVCLVYVRCVVRGCDVLFMIIVDCWAYEGNTNYVFVSKTYICEYIRTWFTIC